MLSDHQNFIDVNYHYGNFHKNIKGIVLSGGPLNVYENNKVKFNSKILKLGIPVLGICFGHQIISKELGGRVKNSKFREFGLAEVEEVKKSILTKNFFSKGKNNVWMSHADQVTKLPKNFHVLAKSKNSKLCIIEHLEKKFFFDRKFIFHQKTVEIYLFFLCEGSIYPNPFFSENSRRR